MSYVTNHLLPNEFVEHLGKTTYLYLIPPFLGMILFLILGAILGEEIEELGYVGFIIAGLFLISLLSRLITIATSEFAITNKRIVLKRGLISIQVSDIALDKCDGVSFSQGFWGRILGFGVVSTSSTGAKAQKYPALSQPGIFRNKLFLIIDKYKNLAR